MSAGWFGSYEAVLLDAGGVLVLPHAGHVADALRPVGIEAPSRELVERAHYAAVLALDTLPPEQLGPGSYANAYVQALGIPEAQSAEACAAILQMWNRRSLYSWRARVRGTGVGLRRLAATGLKLGIISNSDGTIERQLRRAKICQVGPGRGTSVLMIVDSAVFGVAKPERAIFDRAVAALGVRPERTLYVGDSLYFDVRGAELAGLVPIHFDPHAQCPAPGGHRHIRALAQVADVAQPV
jgi:putative hydrolase of the HAD superfamily